MSAGQVTQGAPRVVPAGVGDPLPVGRLRLSGRDTGGAFEVIELSSAGGPPPHIHRSHDELFHILEGTFMFVLGATEVAATAGDLVFVPRGTRHGFSTPVGSRALVVTIPSGLEGFFRELGHGLAAGRSAGELRRELAEKYDSQPGG